MTDNVVPFRARDDDSGDPYHVCTCGGYRFALMTSVWPGAWVALRTDGSVMAYHGVPTCIECGVEQQTF